METDDDRPAARLEPVDKRASEELLQVLQFVVDGNSQGLKHACGRVNVGVTLLPAPRRSGDDADEIGSGPVGEFRTSCDDRASNRSAGALFPEPLKKAGQLGFAERGQQIGRRWAFCRIEAHVERLAARRDPGASAALNSEAPRCVGQLVGREPEVEQDAIDLADSE